MMMRVLTEYPRQGGRSGPFARLWAAQCDVCIAFEPGHRLSADISGRTALEVMPSGVFYPTVDNQFAGSPDPFLLQADSLALQAKGYGPIKLRQWIDPESYVNPPSKPEGKILVEGYPPQEFLDEAEEICCVIAAEAVDAARDYLASIGATCLALYDVTDEAQLSSSPLPVVMYTTKKLPMKVKIPE